MDKQQTLRSTAIKYGVDKMTLLRYCRKYKENNKVSFKPNYSSAQVFSNEEENLLMDYLLKSASLYYGLTPITTRKFAYLFAKENNKKIPNNWIHKEAASLDWLYVS